MDLSDEAAVAQARAGESDAFRLLVERHSRKVFAVAYRLTGNETDAEDVVQETFLRAYRNLNQFDEKAIFSSWLYRIASNYALDLLRFRKSHAVTSLSTADEGGTDASERLPSPSPGPDRIALSSQLNVRIADAMESLTPHERTAFTLRHFEGHTIEEIGSVLRLGGNATKQVVFRAVQKMRRALEPLAEGAAWRS